MLGYGTSTHAHRTLVTKKWWFGEASSLRVQPYGHVRGFHHRGRAFPATIENPPPSATCHCIYRTKG